MGEGNYGGNGSVHWSIDHENGGKDLRVKTNELKRPKKGEDDIHIKNAVYGRDDKQAEYFDVTLRFEQGQNPNPVSQLMSALQQATSAAAGASFFVTFRVPATVNGVHRPSPEEQLWPDVRVRW